MCLMTSFTKNAAKVYCLSENCCSPHEREGQGEKSLLAFKGTFSDMNTMNRAVFDRVKRVLFYTIIEKF